MLNDIDKTMLQLIANNSSMTVREIHDNMYENTDWNLSRKQKTKLGYRLGRLESYGILFSIGKPRSYSLSPDTVKVFDATISGKDVNTGEDIEIKAGKMMLVNFNGLEEIILLEAD